MVVSGFRGDSAEYCPARVAVYMRSNAMVPSKTPRKVDGFCRQVDFRCGVASIFGTQRHQGAKGPPRSSGNPGVPPGSPNGAQSDPKVSPESVSEVVSTKISQQSYLNQVISTKVFQPSDLIQGISSRISHLNGPSQVISTKRAQPSDLN